MSAAYPTTSEQPATHLQSAFSLSLGSLFCAVQRGGALLQTAFSFQLIISITQPTFIDTSARHNARYSLTSGSLQSNRGSV